MTLSKFKVKSGMADTHTLLNDYHSNINASVPSHSFFCVVRVFKIYSFSSFQVCNIVLSTVGSTLCIRFSELTHLIKSIHIIADGKVSFFFMGK